MKEGNQIIVNLVGGDCSGTPEERIRSSSW